MHSFQTLFFSTHLVSSTDGSFFFVVFCAQKTQRSGMSESAGASLPWANPQKEGFLNKRGHVVRNWKKRWFRLKNDMLYYFKDPDAQPVGEVPLKRSEVAPTNKVNKPFCFELNSKEIEKVCFLKRLLFCAHLRVFHFTSPWNRSFTSRPRALRR